MENSIDGAQNITDPDEIRGQSADSDGRIKEAKSRVSEFPYAGIFSPGGFLSQVSDNDNSKEELRSDVAVSMIKLSSSEQLEYAPILQSQKVCNESRGEVSHAEIRSSESPLAVIQHSGQPNASDLPPMESVFHIDHILEHILNYLKVPDLLHSRLVSHRWFLISQKLLQKRLTLTFDGNIVRTYLDRSRKRINEDEIKSLNELSCLLQTSQGFPCVKFFFDGISFMDNDFQNFLNFHGSLIEELTLYLGNRLASAGEPYQLPHEREIMFHVRRLLSEQVLNLRVFTIKIPCNVSWSNNVGRSENNYLQPNDPELNEIYEECKGLKNTSLKVLSIVQPWNSKVVETILQIASNLVEIRCAGSGDTLACYSKVCSLNPKNRIHLLKDVYVHESNVGTFEEILDNAQACEIKLQLRAIWFLSFTQVNFNSELKLRLANVISRILEMCWNSLEKLAWSGDISVSILPAIKFPVTMPKVRKLYFSCNNSFPGPDSKFVPVTNFSSIFTNVRSISGHSWSDGGFTNFPLWFYNNPMPGVKRVHLHTPNMPPGHFQIISELFPNATVS